MKKFLTVAAAGSLLAGCADTPQDPTREFTAGIELEVAALNLPDVGDVIWDIQVVNGTNQVVWEQRISSNQYGDSGGSASYVGPCDADTTSNNDENTVKVWVVGVYNNNVPAADVKAFNSGSHANMTTGLWYETDTVGGVDTNGNEVMPFQNPTATGPLTRKFQCTENQDTFVQFDVALMRPAQQGFFDIAVNFNNIFCSAKFDCAYESAGTCNVGNGTCTTGQLETGVTTCTTNDHCKVRADIKLLHDDEGTRTKTFVLGFACTAGFGTGTTTQLYMNSLRMDCGGGDILVYNVDGVGLNTDGNQCSPSATGMTCPAGVVVDENSASVTAVTRLFQLAVYRGSEQLTGANGTFNKKYWNVAMGINAATTGCTLTTDATADDLLNTNDNVNDKTIAEGTVYPFIEWDVNLATCGAEPLQFGVASAMVTTAYTTTDQDAANVYNPKVFNYDYP